jgi:phage terminase large subunit-like protein
MTPLQERKLLLKVARQKLIQLGTTGYYEWINGLDDELYQQFNDAISDPALSLRPKQEMPDGDWYIWMLRTARGFGKNHAASGAISQLVEFEFPGQVGLIVGATHKDVRDTILGGPSGLVALARPGMEPVYSDHHKLITWPNGSKAMVRTGDSPEDIRGQSVPWAYADELIKWPKGKVSFDNISMCVREGDHPRIILTSTPLRGAEWLKRIEDRDDCIVTTGRTKENIALPPAYLKNQSYLDSKKFAEEAEGEWVADNGNLWSREQLDAVTVKNNSVPDLAFLDTCDRRAISIDPSQGKRDLAGMSLLAVKDDLKWIMADLTPNKTMKIADWTAHLRAQAARYLKPGDTILVETNGFAGIDESLQREFPEYHVVPIFHTGKDSQKVARAERAQMHYQNNTVRHFRPMPELERQMMEFYDVVDSNTESPDRADALITGINWLADLPAPLMGVWSMSLSGGFSY